MRKKAVIILLSSVLCLTLFGCGTSSNTDTQTQQEETVEQESEHEADFEGLQGDISFFATKDLEEYGKYDLNGEYEEIDPITVTSDEEVSIWNQEGIQIGNVKAGVALTYTEHGVGSIWFRLKNPISGTPYEYLYVKDEETNLNLINAPKSTDNQTEPTVESEAVVSNYEDRSIWSYPLSKTNEEYNDFMLKLESSILTNIDVEKSYTQEEVQEIFITIIEDNGLKWTPELAEIPADNYWDNKIYHGESTLSTNGTALQEQIFNIIFYSQWNAESVKMQKFYYKVLSEENGDLKIKYLEQGEPIELP